LQGFHVLFVIQRSGKAGEKILRRLALCCSHSDGRIYTIELEDFSTLDMVTFTFAAEFPSESWGTFTTKPFRGVSYLTSSIVKTRAAAAGILLRRE